MKAESTIMEVLIEQVISRSRRLQQLKGSLNDLAASVTRLAVGVHRLANVVNEHAENLKKQVEINDSNNKLLAILEEGVCTNASAIDALQSYMGVSVIFDDEDDVVSQDPKEVN